MPIGVSELPIFAATVCRAIVGTASRSCPDILSTAIPNGTKVIRATSFVMTILKKKGRKTSAKSICDEVRVFLKSLSPRKTKSPPPEKPCMTAISEKRRVRVSQST